MIALTCEAFIKIIKDGAVPSALYTLNLNDWSFEETTQALTAIQEQMDPEGPWRADFIEPPTATRQEELQRLEWQIIAHRTERLGASNVKRW